MYSLRYRFRIFRQPQGHLLLIGVSGAGKTTLSRFVAWMNGLSVYQIKVGLRRLFIQQWVWFLPGAPGVRGLTCRCPRRSTGSTRGKTLTKTFGQC